MKKVLIWTAIIAVLLLLVWNLVSDHVTGVKSEKDWYLSQLKFDCSGTLDSAEKSGQALIHVKHGWIDVGKEANVTIFDPQRTWTLNEKTNASKSKNSPWFGREIKGKAIGVFNNSRNLIDA